MRQNPIFNMASSLAVYVFNTFKPTLFTLPGVYMVCKPEAILLESFK